MELFNLIRREHFLHGKSVRQIAKQHHVHRRMVRQALKSAAPPKRKKSPKEEYKLTQPIKYFIDHWLQADKKAPYKQRHTAHRIFMRLVEEHEFKGAEPTIRKYVGQRRRELFCSSEAFIIQVHSAGEEAEVDWYEAKVDFPSGRRKVYIFQMRACASGKEFHIGFLTQNQQAFLEGHAAAFEYFNGVFKKIRYDNLASAVKKVLQGRKRIENEKFMLLRSHYLFEAIFCKVGIEGAHEKGGVEGGVGRFRRNYLVPVPKVNDINEFNYFLKKCCGISNKRRISGKTKTIEEVWQEECQQLLLLPFRFSTQETRHCKVNDKSLVCFASNYYSLPVKLIGKEVELHISSLEIGCYYQGIEVARHVRSFETQEILMKLDHYLDLLKYKPGAFEGSLVLQKTKAKDEWSPLYDKLWKKLNERLGESKGTQMLIEILLLAREFGQQKVLSAIQAGLDYGSYDKNAILVLIRQQALRLSPSLLDNIECLQKYERPAQDLGEYNQLLCH